MMMKKRKEKDKMGVQSMSQVNPKRMTTLMIFQKRSSRRSRKEPIGLL